MAARFLGVTLVGSIVWFAWHWREYSLARAGVRILVFAFAGAILGKLVGIAVSAFHHAAVAPTANAPGSHAHSRMRLFD